VRPMTEPIAPFDYSIVILNVVNPLAPSPSEPIQCVFL
jgi:hypothetical protein